MGFKVWLYYHGAKDGKGWFSTRTDHDLRTVKHHLEDGSRVSATVTQPRSVKHQAYFFVKMQKVFDNLPETEGRFETSERLRKWLSCKAGWCDQTTFSVSDPSEFQPLIKALTQQSDDWFFGIRGNKLTMVRAKSTNFAAMDKKEFIEFDEAVDRVIQNEFGIDPIALMKETSGEVEE